MYHGRQLKHIKERAQDAVNGNRKLISCRLWLQAIIAKLAAQKTSEKSAVPGSVEVGC
jgi:hypothetical protein